MKRVAALLFASVFVASSVGFAWMDDEEEKPKYTTKQVMAKVFKGRTALLSKVSKGTATEEEKKSFMEYLNALAKNSPSKGDAESWKTKTAALIKAGKAVVAGDEGGGAALKKAANCAACHKAHKK